MQRTSFGFTVVVILAMSAVARGDDARGSDTQGVARGSDAGDARGPASTDGSIVPTGLPGTAPPSPHDWHFSWRGYFRAPLRIGVGHRNACPPNVSPYQESQRVLGPQSTIPYTGVYCAAPGQSHTTLHSPYVPDDQYVAWTYDRQWEQARTEVFLSYGNDVVTGTIGLQGYDFTDTSLLGNQADPAQFGIGQGWVTVTPDLPVSGLRLNWKVGAFWELFGTPSDFDGGPYDTYMFGRTHQIGESLAFEYDTGPVTMKLEHGFGAHLEGEPAGIPISGNQNSLTYFNGAEGNGFNNGQKNSYPPGASAGFTLLDHVHAGVRYGRWLDLNAHYLAAWSADDREQGTLGNGSSSGNTMGLPNQSTFGDGSLSVYGVEARVHPGPFGQIYAAYSHIDAKNVTEVGPAIEVLHSAGGGGHNAGNGIYENFFNGVGNGTGRIDSVQAGVDVGILSAIRALGTHASSPVLDGPDVKLSLFVMYSAVSGTDPTSMNLLNGVPTAGTGKLKYGADVLAQVLPWLGVGARGDYVSPDSHDVHEAFGVLSPKVVFRTKFVTHEEVTLQYSHYWDGADVLPQQWLTVVGPKNIARPAAAAYTNYSGPNYPNDRDVFGMKATLWW